MSARVVWDEMLRRLQAGELEVRVQDLIAVHPYAGKRITTMVRSGDLVRVRPGVVRIVTARLPARLQPEVHA